ncbi:MAG: diaminopimelate epimerase [Lachnospiraceae bacterium]|jgi:diaminopimelate epimerase|nr:diaminopimelate epimerase [Lachnospiraceae bacterium]
MKIAFTKMQGCGNDYIYVNGIGQSVPEAERGRIARKLSDRHFGIGSDGLIVIDPPTLPGSDFQMSMYNADGSKGKMCGNGIRCVGKYVYDHGMTGRREVHIESCGVPHTLLLQTDGGKATGAVVDMGAPILRAGDIPVTMPGGADVPQIVDEPVEAGGRIWHMTCVSMGNPHAVIFPDRDAGNGSVAVPLARMDLEKLGPCFENNPRFPDRTNTEFVHVTDRENVEMRVWERGSGETLACGTGCCATGVACVLNGLTDAKIRVHVLGGILEIEWDRERNRVMMTGPAETVFDGTVEV